MNRNEIRAIATELRNQMQSGTQRPPGQGQSRTARKRRNQRRTNANPNTNQRTIAGKAVPLVTTGTTLTSLTRRPNRGNMLNVKMGKLSREGLLFLKAVLAAPDYAGQGSFVGIPDHYSYPILPYRHVVTNNLVTLINAIPDYQWPEQGLMDVCIIQPPVPGVAAYIATGNVGFQISTNTSFLPIPFDDFNELFGANVYPAVAGVYDSKLTNFRMAGNSIEIINQMNEMSWQGSIQAYKVKLALGDATAYSQTVGTQLYQLTKTVTGLESLNTSGTSSYMAPLKMGVFMTAVNPDPEFLNCSIPDFIPNINAGSTTAIGILQGIFTGMGQLETNVIWLRSVPNPAFPNPVGPLNLGIRMWSSIEYIPEANSVFSKMLTPSPPIDPQALALYRTVVQELPVAVSYFENDTFWQRLVGLFNKVSRGLSFVPGPVGAIATGLNAAGNAVADLIA